MQFPMTELALQSGAHLPIDGRPVLVEFGAGGNRPPGYIVHDIEVDIRRPLPYPDSYVDKIRAEHVCEHVSGPDFYHFLKQCLRILKPGGRLRLCMPVLDRLEPAHAADIICNHGHLAAYTSELILRYINAAGFVTVECLNQDADETDGHWKQIGHERDRNETFRVEAIK
jgi:predicted SAM-dependent methyltransferase